MGTAVVMAGDALTASGIDRERHLVDMQVARLHPVDATIGDFDELESVGEAIDEVSVF